ncbi:MAG: hypothetical protein ACREBE_29115 [bacterium]
MRSAPSLAASALLLATCATSSPARDAWASDWNQRIDGAKTPFEHPCATRPFIAWADGFLAGCDPHTDAASQECETRVDWVEARVAQCRAWTAWQLRNFNQHERTEAAPPSMRIE